MTLKRIVTADRNMQTIQDNVAQVLADLERTPFQDGILHGGISLPSGAKTFAHALGRIPRGWVVTDRDAAATIYRVSWDAKFITLQASAAVNVSVWVF